MAQYDKGSDEDWIVDGKLGHRIWNKIEGSTYVRFTEGIAILAKLVRSREDKNLIRMAGEEPNGPEDWAEPFSLFNPEMRMQFNFSRMVTMESPNEVKMAIYSKTTNGANFTHEFSQEEGKEAEGLIRVPVPDELREEALSISDGYDNCEMVREQAGAFQDRFSVTDESPPGTYWEPHIKCTGITDIGEIIVVFDEVLDIVERGVRANRA